MDPGGSAPPLFLVHGADGGIDMVHPIARHLPHDRPVWGIRMEGYASAPPPRRSIEELARRYVRELKQARPVGPYVVGGYSIGGALAFEMVHQLEAGGDRVSLILLIDSRFPPAGDDSNASDGRGAVAALPRPPRPLIGRLWRRHVSDRCKRVIIWACVGLGWPLPLWWGIRTRYFWRMLASARDAYGPRPIRAPMLVFAADGCAAAHEATWAPLYRGGARVIELAAEHLELLCEPWVSELVFHLQETLMAVEPPTEVGAPPATRYLRPTNPRTESMSLAES